MFRTIIIIMLASKIILAMPLPCISSLRTLQGINPTDLSQSYLLKIDNILTGELDPNPLGDGGVTTAILISDSGKSSSYSNPHITFVLLESNDNHPITSKIAAAVSRGWPFLLLKRSCVSTLKNKNQILALADLVNHHMHPPTHGKLQFFIFD